LCDRSPDFIGTPRQVDAEIDRITRNVGQSTYLAIQIRTRTSQEEISRNELADYLFERQMFEK